MANLHRSGPGGYARRMGPRAGWSIALVLVFAACDAVSVTGAWCQYPADCHRPNDCSYHRCRPRCVAGADCPGTHLCLAGHCAVEQDRGCAAVAGRECTSPLVCAEDRCTLRCTGSCMGDALCRPASDQPFDVCVDPSQPLPDAGSGLDAR